MTKTFFAAGKKIISRVMVVLTVMQSVVVAVPAANAANQAGAVVHPMVAAGYSHTLALKSDGTVWAWGFNGQGQLGDGSNTASNSPVQVSGLANVKYIVALGSYSVALKTDGTVWAWGQNNNGQLGDATYTNSNVPVQVTSLTGVISIAAGFGHVEALKSDGTVWGWGRNYYGMLGNGFDHTSAPIGTHDTEATPVQVSGLSDVRAIATGGEHSMALKADGTVWAWGASFEGELGDGSTTWSNVPVQTSTISNVKAIGTGFYHSLAIEADGTAWAWGDNWAGMLGDASNTQRTTPVQVSGITNAVAIDGGDYHSFARLADGSAKTWGYNSNGQLGDGSNTDSNVPLTISGLSTAAEVTGGETHTIVLKTDGTVWGTGNNSNGQLGDGSNTDSSTLVQVPSFNLYVASDGAIAVAAGGVQSLALKADGTVWAWGFNGNGALGDGTNTDSATPVSVSSLSSIVAVAAGQYHSAALKSDGTVWTWGRNNYGQLGNGTGAALNDAFNSNVPVQVSGLTNIVAIGTGMWHSVAVRADGTVWAWGRNTAGELGNGNNTHSNVPVQVTGLTNAVAATGGADQSIFLKANGTVWGSGFNTGGGLGNGTNTNTNTIVQASGITTAKMIAAGDSHSSALLTDGTVKTWGYNGDGELGNGSNTDTNTPVSVSSLSAVEMIVSGGYHMVALLDNGTLKAWGANWSGQLGNGNNTDSNVPVSVDNTNLNSDVKAIAANAIGEHSLAILSDGTVWAWGNGYDGELGNNTFVPSNVPVMVLFPAPPPPPGPPLNTTNNYVALSRIAVNATATATIHFVLNDTLSSQLTMTFDPAFTGMDVGSASALTPSAPGCMSNFVATGPNTFTADKSSCTGEVIITGVTVVNPPTPGGYLVSWTNDDPGYAMVAIVDSDQVNVNAQVDPSITFDLNTGATNAPVSAPYSVALGSLTIGAVNHSDNSTVNSVWANLDTNATGGAVVTVLSQNAALKSLSVGTDTIPNSAAAMAAGTANYGLCVNTVTPPTQAAGTFEASAPYNAGTCDPAGSANDVKALSTVTPTSILDSNANPVTTGSAEILVNAAISTATVAHSDYADVLTFVATGTF